MILGDDTMHCIASPTFFVSYLVALISLIVLVGLVVLVSAMVVVGRLADLPPRGCRVVDVGFPSGYFRERRGAYLYYLCEAESMQRCERTT